jgi:hypothetical protein
MSTVTPYERRCFEDLFGAPSSSSSKTGDVLDFTKTTFADFFHSKCKIDIEQAKYAIKGETQINRLRSLWQIEDDALVGAVCRELLKKWEQVRSVEIKGRLNGSFLRSQRTVARLLGEKPFKPSAEDLFLDADFTGANVEKLRLEPALIPLIADRLQEALRCQEVGANLSVIFHCGALLEAILLGTAVKDPSAFTSSPSAPKQSDGGPKALHLWKLGELIDSAADAKLISQDAQKFSATFREFRSYIHPYEQLATDFKPDQHAAEISVQVVRSVILSLT